MNNQQSTEHIDVRYVAHLARMNLDDSEAAVLQGQLEHILEYVQRIRELDVSGIEPTSHARPVTNVFREDEVRPGLDHETVMENAPKSGNGLFAVPQIIE